MSELNKKTGVIKQLRQEVKDLKSEIQALKEAWAFKHTELLKVTQAGIHLRKGLEFYKNHSSWSSIDEKVLEMWDSLVKKEE